MHFKVSVHAQLPQECITFFICKLYVFYVDMYTTFRKVNAMCRLDITLLILKEIIFARLLQKYNTDNIDAF